MEPGEAVQSPQLWILARGLCGAFSVIAAVGCGQGVEVLANNPPPREDARRNQAFLDVAAIVAGMMRAHGAQAEASLPKWWRDLLSQPMTPAAD